MPRPRLTVFLANYNQAKWLPRALAAIASQDRRPDQMVIVDDASHDSSVNVIEQFSRQYPWIRLIRNRRHEGFYRALKRLPELTRDEYIFATGADDYVLPGFFTHAMEWAQRYPQAGLIMGEMVMVTPTERIRSVARIEEWRYAQYVSPERFLQEYVETVSPDHSLCGATVYRRDSLQEVGWFREDLKHWTDSFAARAIGLRAGAVYLPRPLTAWTVRSQSLSQRRRYQVSYNFAWLRQAASLMRSSRFRDRFPLRHVRRWEVEYRRQVLMWLTDALYRFELTRYAHDPVARERYFRWRRRLIQALEIGGRSVWPLGSKG